MKRGTNAIMNVKLGLELDTVESCEFLFVQGKTRLIFEYPSARAVRDGDHINLIWTDRETFAFKSGEPVKMDTHVHVRDMFTNPTTEIASMMFDPTLFTMEEIDHD